MTITLNPTQIPQTIPTATATQEGVFTLTGIPLVNPVITGYLVLGNFTDASRPAANTVPSGGLIYNSDDFTINISDGVNWRDGLGEIT